MGELVTSVLGTILASIVSGVILKRILDKKIEEPIPKGVALRIVFKKGVQKGSEGSYEVEAYRGILKLKYLRIKTSPQVSGNVRVENGNKFLWVEDVPPNSVEEYDGVGTKRFILFGWVEEEISEDREIILEYEGTVEWSYLSLLIAKIVLLTKEIRKEIKMKIRKILRKKPKVSPEAIKMLKESQKYFERLLSEGDARRIRVIVNPGDHPLLLSVNPLIKDGKILKGYPSRSSIKIAYYPT